MRPEFRERWSAEAVVTGTGLKTPQDLIARQSSAEDFVDTAVIGGVGIGDVVSGNISEAQIPPDVREAFHLQYPNEESFVHAIREHANDPQRIMGIVNGVKGKLFEISYTDWLNDGHLPAGYTANLATSATQPAWDIRIENAQGHVAAEVQLKATETIAYVRSAIAAHPDIPVVVPHDAFDALASDPSLAPHLVDGYPQTLSALTQHVGDSVDHVHTGLDYLHIPEVAIAWAAMQNYSAYRRRSISFGEAVRNFGSRSVLVTIASGAGWGAAAVAHSTLVGIPVTMLTRLLGGQFIHNRSRRSALDQLVANVGASRERLCQLIDRPLVAVVLPE